MSENLSDVDSLKTESLSSSTILEEGSSIFASDFPSAHTLEELAGMQGVLPLTDVSSLFGTWPGTEEDGFEDDVRTLRQRNPVSENKA